MALSKIPFLLFLLSIVVFSAEKQDSLKSYRASEIGVSANAKVRSSAISYDEIDSEMIELKTSNVDLPNLLNGLTSVYTYSENGNNVGYTNLRLRGFDQRRISVFVNGVPINDPEINNVFWLNYSDLQESIGEIQVQRGAGISGFGSPSIAGAVSINTTNYINNPGVRISSGVGYQTFGDQDEIRANTSKFTAEYSSGLVDGKYAFYGKLGRINSWGYRNNSDVQATNFFFSGTRLGENYTLQLNVFGGGQTDGLAYSGVGKDDVNDLNLRRANPLNFNGREREQFFSPHYQLLTEWRINPNFKINSTNFYFEGEGYFDFNAFSFAPADLGFNPTTNPGPATMDDLLLRGFVRNRQIGRVTTADWNHKGGNLKVGIEGRMHKSDHYVDIQFSDEYPENYPVDYKINEWNSGKNIFSLFAKEQYSVTDDLIVNLEAQFVYNNYYFENEKFGGQDQIYYDFDGNAIGSTVFDVDYLFFNPRLGVNYNLTDNLSFYSSIAYTNREPRRNSIYNADFRIYGNRPNFETRIITADSILYNFENPLIEPEKLFNVEIGANYTSDYVNGGLNFYLMDYTDELIQDGVVDFYGVPVDINAPNTIHYGVELSGRHIWKLPKKSRLGFDLNLTYSVNEIQEFTTSLVDTASNPIDLDLSGNTIAGFPDFIFNAGLDYQIGNLFSRFDVKTVSDFYWNNLTEEQQSLVSATGTSNVVASYFVANFNVRYNIGKVLWIEEVVLQAQINNLFNELYAPFANEYGYFSAAERNFYLGIQLGL